MAKAIEAKRESAEDVRERLHLLVDHLADDDLHAASCFLEFVHHQRDPVVASFLAAPYDDEPTTPQENAGSAEAWQEYLRGEGRPWREVCEELLAR